LFEGRCVQAPKVRCTFSPDIRVDKLHELPEDEFERLEKSIKEERERRRLEVLKEESERRLGVQLGGTLDPPPSDSVTLPGGPDLPYALRRRSGALR
jgi:hypothetical protein